MLTKYIRDDNKRPIGVLIATEANEVGWSLCNKKDNWDKIKGLRIAFNRATVGFHCPVPNSIYNEYYAMVDRADRYYRNKRYF